MPERVTGYARSEKSAEAVVGMANPSEGPNMKAKGEASRFVVMAAQKSRGTNQKVRR